MYVSNVDGPIYVTKGKKMGFSNTFYLHMVLHATCGHRDSYLLRSNGKNIEHMKCLIFISLSSWHFGLQWLLPRETLSFFWILCSTFSIPSLHLKSSSIFIYFSFGLIHLYANVFYFHTFSLLTRKSISSPFQVYLWHMLHKSC